MEYVNLFHQELEEKFKLMEQMSNALEAVLHVQMQFLVQNAKMDII